MRLLARIKEFGYARERAAVAALALSYFCVLYGLIAFGAPVELRPWRAAFAALASCYITAFLGLASGWFWARWFASGLAWSGAMMGLAGLVMVGWQPAVAIYGALHGAVVILLGGPKMAERYEGQAGWRERFRVDDFGVGRVRKYVTRAAAALPGLILWALAPRDQGALVSGGLAVLVLAAGAGVLRGRTWGLLATCSAAGALAWGGMSAVSAGVSSAGWPGVLVHAGASAGAIAAAVLLAAAAAPFVGPAVRYFRSLPR